MNVKNPGRDRFREIAYSSKVIQKNKFDTLLHIIRNVDRTHLNCIPLWKYPKFLLGKNLFFILHYVLQQLYLTLVL